MVGFVKKRLQVFVSSTYLDLKDERQAAVGAILTTGHIPAGMELFTAGNESQWEVIKQWIDESDVYLLILGGRYGSIEPKSGKSYTHLEYEYALNKNKPHFSCVMNSEVMDAVINKQITENRKAGIENAQKLEEFQKIITDSKMVGFWASSKDIENIVLKALLNFERSEDLNLIGWVRPNTEENIPAHIAEEIARLSKENAELRVQLEKSGADTINGLYFEELKEMLEKEDLLNVLKDNKSALGVFGVSCITTMNGDFYTSIDVDSQKLVKLCELGLVLMDGKSVRLKDAGRIFLNKLELLESKQNTMTIAEIEN